MKWQPLLMTILCLMTLGELEAQPKSGEDKHEPAQLAIYAARSTPVSDLASVLAQVWDDDSVQVAADPASNLLLIRIRSGEPKRVLELLKQLDRQPRTVLVEAHLITMNGDPLTDQEAETLSGSSEKVANSIDQLKSNDRVVVAKHMKLAALENQPSLLQVGKDAVLPAKVTTGGRTGVRLETIRTGTMLKVTARTRPENVIQLTVDFETSSVESSEDDDANAAVSSRLGVSELVHQSTVQLGSGQSRLVGALAGGQPSEASHAYLIVAARIADEPASQRSTSVRTFNGAPSAGRQGRPARSEPGAGGKESSVDARYRNYFRAMIARYDTDKDGQLSSKEWKTMSRSPEAADVNEDGFVTLDELVQWQRKR